MGIGINLVPGHYYKVWWYNHERTVACEWTGKGFRAARGQQINDEVDWTREPVLIGNRDAYESYVRACELAS